MYYSMKFTWPKNLSIYPWTLPWNIQPLNGQTGYKKNDCLEVWLWYSLALHLVQFWNMAFIFNLNSMWLFCFSYVHLKFVLTSLLQFVELPHQLLNDNSQVGVWKQWRVKQISSPTNELSLGGHSPKTIPKPTLFLQSDWQKNPTTR